MPEPLHFQIDEYYLGLQKQGQDMDILDENRTRRNPFPGLRPFRTGEAHLFFGREGQAEELITRLMQTHFLGVLGNSGSGKSSLVRAGLIPALHAGKKQDRISDWKIVICRPGNSPLQNLAAALAGAHTGLAKAEELAPEVARLLPLLQESSFGLLETETDANEHRKTLLIIDQFEELFRFAGEIPPGEAAHFVDLLLTAARQEGAGLYVVITMRSEFLGECVRYRGLPEVINQGQYLVPRLSSENVRRAVAGPLGVVGAPVDATLVNRLVREVGDSMDQLSLLQHALMRTYRHWQRMGSDKPISHSDYEATGEMEKALGRHADEQFEALNDKEQQLTKLIFQRLTDLSAGDKGGRRPTLMAEIYGLAGAIPASQEEVDGVIDHFRQLDTSFLMPPPGAPLQEENMLDISHESLIRNWGRLNRWADEEAENARLYRRLQQAREENEEDPSQGWITGALLQRLDDWRQTTPTNHFWAARYHPGHKPGHDWAANKALYDGNMTFLQQCLKAEQSRAREKEEAIAEKARQKQRTLYRNIIIAISLAAAILVGWLYLQARQTLADLNRLKSQEKVREARVFIDAGQYWHAVQRLEEAVELNKSDEALKDTLAVYQEKLSEYNE